MTIYIDGTPLAEKKLTGVGNFTYRLIYTLSEISSINVHVFSFGGKIQHKLPDNCTLHIKPHLTKKIINFFRRLNILLPFILFFSVPDDAVIIGTNFIIPPTHNKSFPLIHDLCYNDYPELVQKNNANMLRKNIPKTLFRSQGALVPSNFTANRIKQVYNYKKPILVITPLPDTKKQFTVKPTILNKVDNFLLFTGTIEPRKNLLTLIESYELLSSKFKMKYKLVIAGKKGWDNISLEKLNYVNTNDIIFVEYPSNNELAWLYSNAEYTIIPSLYEGFGMTSLESLVYKTPVLMSDIPTHREIFGDSGIYFNPNDKLNLSSTVIKYIPKKSRDKILLKQLKILKTKSWHDNVIRLVDFIS